MDDRRHRRRPAACLALTLALALPFAAARAADGPTAPDFALRAASGGNHRLSEHRGEVVALLFWASWCGECRRELERFERLRRTYGNAGLVVLGVNLDKDPGQARAIADAAGIGYPVLLDVSKAVSRSYRANELPLIVLVDRHGVVRARHDALDEREERGLLVSLRDLIDE
ncbi:MAG: TlpA family protein disulfide reductase [Steroidobacteraceae bacterium]|nr:TlpA family protein disulfide reductase [Steroidobacteraceae bacterium]